MPHQSFKLFNGHGARVAIASPGHIEKYEVDSDNDIEISLTNGKSFILDSSELERLTTWLCTIDGSEQSKKEGDTMDRIKKYIDSHADMIFTTMFVIIIDHFILGGALRQRIQGLCERMVGQQEGKLDASPAEKQ